ncbi:MAG: globin [Specibacter sp.]
MNSENLLPSPATQGPDATGPAEGTPIPPQFGEPQPRMLPFATTLGRPVPTATPVAGPEEDEPADYSDTFYGQVGGRQTFATIIHVFYQGVAADPLLRALYPEEDLGPAERRMLMFIEQYWGGPRTYLEERGHPRLRMRHVPFAVTPEARDHWLAAMRKGVDAAQLSPMHDATLWDYLERAAHSLVNSA